MLLTSNGFTQTIPQIQIRQSILDTAKLIGEFKFVDMDVVGPGGMNTNQLQRFIFLLENATNEELSNLVNDKNANVRAYAFWSLALKKYDKIKDVLESKLNDITPLHCRFNCANVSMPINHFYLTVLSSKNSFMHGITLSKDELLKYQNRIKNKM